VKAAQETLAAAAITAGVDLRLPPSVAVLNWPSSAPAQTLAPIFITGCAFRC
jgi:hypothetical protein